MTAHASEGTEEDIKKVFQLYDVDNTGYISLENLVRPDALKLRTPSVPEVCVHL